MPKGPDSRSGRDIFDQNGDDLREAGDGFGTQLIGASMGAIPIAALSTILALKAFMLPLILALPLYSFFGAVTFVLLALDVSRTGESGSDSLR